MLSTFACVAAIGWMVGLVSCKSTGHQAGSGPANLEPTFDHATDQQLYQTMVGLELAAGVEVPVDTAHTAFGTLYCASQESGPACSLRVALPEPHILSGHQTLPAETAERLWEHATDGREDLQEGKLVADLTCSFAGSLTPPFAGSGSRCTLSAPRREGEVIFRGEVAEEVRLGLLGGQSLEADLQGQLLCRWQDVSERVRCVVRPQIGDITARDPRPLSDHVAPHLARGLLTVADAAGQTPASLSGSIRCKPQSDGICTLQR